MATILNNYSISGGDTTSSTFTSAGDCVTVEATTTNLSGVNSLIKIQSSDDQSTWKDIGQIYLGVGSDTYCNDPIKITGLYIRCLLVTNDSISGTITITASDGAAGTGDLLAANNLSDVADAPTSRTNLDLGNVSNTSDATKVTNQQDAGTALVPFRQEITELECATLNSVPVDISDLPAPGAGFAWEIVSFNVKYTFVAVDYDFSTMWVFTETATSNSPQFLTSTPMGVSGADSWGLGQAQSINKITIIENKKMQISVDIDPTVGDGTFVVYGSARKITI